MQIPDELRFVNMAHERGVQGYLWSERSRVSQGTEGYAKDDPCIKM